jgi:hypothetical protein
MVLLQGRRLDVCGVEERLKHVSFVQMVSKQVTLDRDHRFERITRCKLTIISESAVCKKFLGQIWSYVASL